MFTYVYLLKSDSDGKFYVGCTSDLRRRIRDHNAGKSFATKGRRPFQLIYYEAHPNQKDAEARELFFKSGWGRQYIQRVLRNHLKAKT